MNTLIIQLPPQPRFLAESGATAPSQASSVAAVADAADGAAARGEYAYVLTPNGHTIARQGVAAPSALPPADVVILVIEPSELSWHRLTLPKAPAARLRQALGGVLEEQLLADPEALHLAVAPDAQAGQLVWVAACHHAALTAHLMAFEKANVRIDRVVPAIWPDAPPVAYFQELVGTVSSKSGQAPELMVTWSTPEGVGSWPLAGSMARAMLPDPLPPGARFLATPAAAAPAERWLGHAVVAQLPAEQWLLAGRSMWNLLQFDLMPNSKGFQALSDRWRQFMAPAWRPVRFGLIALLLTQVLGLNVWAWQQQRTLKAKRAEMTTLLQAAHPQVQVVLDPVVQMRRATDALRGASGQAGPQDLEFLMRSVAAAWVGDSPAKGLIYDGASLDVGVPDFWTEPEVNAFADRLRQMGLRTERNDRQLRVRAPGADA
jgi:general secretion pathway protein L